MTLLFFVVSVGLLYLWESNMTDSPRPLIDSIATSVGFTGALLTTLRFKESYYFWFIQSIVSITLWGITAMQGGSNWVLFFTYILY
ncbi:nicotinamide mononucleotide transporter, partial [Staphylococcus epidermidis]